MGKKRAMKTKRQNEILRMISAREIETQEELAEALRKQGYNVTQATVSRDIRELRLVKIAGDIRAYRYALPERSETVIDNRLIRILRDSLSSIDYAGQIVVVQTLSGSANVAAEAIDTMEWPEVLGTIAGDNTIFIAVRKEEDASAVTGRIRELISMG